MSKLPESIDQSIGNVTGDTSRGLGAVLGSIFYRKYGGKIKEYQLVKMQDNYEVQQRQIIYNESLIRFRDEVKEKISNIPAEYLKEPSMYLVGKAIDDSEFALEEKVLRDLFTNLIAKSMDKRYSENVIPAMSTALRNLSVNDAVLLKELSRYRLTNYPIVSLELVIRDLYYTFIEYLTLLPINKLTVFEASLSFESLAREGILILRDNKVLKNKEDYGKFYELDVYKEFIELAPNKAKSMGEDTFEARMTQSSFTYCEFGRKLIEICTS